LTSDKPPTIFEAKTPIKMVVIQMVVSPFKIGPKERLTASTTKKLNRSESRRAAAFHDITL